MGPIQGVGYVNELLARLTNSPVRDHTTHDPTREFPLGRALYADFTHENILVPVFATLGLFNVSKALNPRVLPDYMKRHEHLQGQDQEAMTMHEQRWIASRLVPFSARMVTERLSCSGEGFDQALSGQYVRILVNDEVQPLAFCGAEETDNMCSLEAFVDSQGYAKRSGDGDFEKCYS